MKLNYLFICLLCTLSIQSLIAQEADADGYDFKIYNQTEVDSQPIFAKGKMSQADFLKFYLKYPIEAKQKGVEGTVILSLVVKNDGEPSEPILIQGIDSSLNAEAIRIAGLLPYYTPGLKSGQAVSTQVLFPVPFIAPETLAVPLTKASVASIPVATVVQTDPNAVTSADVEDLKAKIRMQQVEGEKIPLYIVDGKLIDSNIDLDANKIESIRVIKGEKALQLYGQIGKNGVVIITTKHFPDS